MVRKWFYLVDADGGAHSGTVDVPVEDVDMLAIQLKKTYADSHLRGIAPSDLMVFRNENKMDVAMQPDASIKNIGRHSHLPIIVRAPSPHSLLLTNAEELRRECEDILTWPAGKEIDIHKIHEFMKPLGGCTRNGKLFWREEERQVASIILGEWPQELVLPEKKSIVLGSPGVGKSTMLCLIALHMALAKQKSVVVVRVLQSTVSHKYCLFFIGHRGDDVVWFSKNTNEERTIRKTYHLLVPDDCPPSIALMLDGFAYDKLPDGLSSFHLLATSQQIDIKFGAMEYSYRCLLPGWRRPNLFQLGEKCHGWSNEEMDERFFYSGGSVREFTLHSAEDAKRAIDVAVEMVNDPSHLLSRSTLVSSGVSQSDRLRRTFVKRENVRDAEAYRTDSYWEQVVDSEYAIGRLHQRIRAKDLMYMFGWAMRGGAAYASLAGLLFEILIHLHAADKTLRLSTTPYHMLPYGSPHDPKSLHFEQLEVKTGTVLCSGIRESDFEAQVALWKHTAKYSYWYPACNELPTVDSIVKLASSDSRVAYLQMTVSKTHSLDVSWLERLNNICQVGEAKPMFVVVCPTEEAARTFTFKQRGFVAKAFELCELHVGYWKDYENDIRADGPFNNIEYPQPPVRTIYNLRDRAQQRALHSELVIEHGDDAAVEGDAMSDIEG